MHIKRTTLTIGLLWWALMSSQYLGAQVDSLKNILAQADSDSLRMEVLNELIARTAYTDTDASLDYASQFDSLAQASGDQERQAHGLKLLGIVEFVAEDYEASITHYQESLEVYRRLQDTFNIGMIHNNLGSVFSDRAQHQRSLDYFRKAAEWFTLAEDAEWQVLVLQNMASIYQETGQLDSALVMYTDALYRYEKPQVKQDAYQPLYEARRGMILVNLANVLTSMGRHEEAIRYGERVANNATVELDEYTQMQLLNALGRSYLAGGEVSRAEEQLQASVALARKLGNRIMTANALEYLVEVARQQGQYRIALAYQDEYLLLKDSLFEASRDEALTELATKYETEQKEREIALLASSNQVKDLQIAKVNRERLLLGLALLLVLIVAGILAFFFRINRQKNQQLTEQKEVIEQALTEKEALLREIHHRVKNNLQIISSLLSLQERRIQGAEGKQVVQESRNRVQSIALIHQNLYQQENLSRIHMEPYLTQLSEQIRRSFDLGQREIDIQLEVDPVELDVDSAIPLGLITNELLTNALKYAFTEAERGRIEVSFTKKGDDQWLLRVHDDGVGIPQKKLVADGDAFGMKLIRTFAQKLQSTLQIDTQMGTAISLRIPAAQLNNLS